MPCRIGLSSEACPPHKHAPLPALQYIMMTLHPLSWGPYDPEKTTTVRYEAHQRDVARPMGRMERHSRSGRTCPSQIVQPPVAIRRERSLHSCEACSSVARRRLPRIRYVSASTRKDIRFSPSSPVKEEISSSPVTKSLVPFLIAPMLSASLPKQRTGK